MVVVLRGHPRGQPAEQGMTTLQQLHFASDRAILQSKRFEDEGCNDDG